VIYKASSDALKVGLLGSLSCGSERIPWVVARNNISWVVAWDGGWTRRTLELWLGLASVVGVSVLVVASTDGSR